MSEKIIVIIDVENVTSGRKMAESIEDGFYKDRDEVTALFPLDERKHIGFLTLSDFMDYCNDNDTPNGAAYWISYVNLENIQI